MKNFILSILLIFFISILCTSCDEYYYDEYEWQCWYCGALNNFHDDFCWRCGEHI